MLISSTEANDVDDGEKRYISDDIRITRDSPLVFSAVALSVCRRTKAMCSGEKHIDLEVAVEVIRFGEYKFVNTNSHIEDELGGR